MHRTRVFLTALLATLTVGIAIQEARAVDGVTEIDHDRALAGGIAVADTPGYPVQIGEAGSYRLTSDLAGGIEVFVASISVDLNGFTIDGAGSATRGISDLSAGVDSVHVFNGVVRNFTQECVQLGDLARVADLRAGGCTSGIRVGDHSMVVRSVARGMGGAGVQTGSGSVVRASITEGNGTGVDTGSRSLAIENTSRANIQRGVDVGAESIAMRNIAAGNTTGVFGSTASVVDGNVVASPSSTGLSSAQDSVVARNSVSDSGGIGLSCTTRCAVVENRVTGAATSGILVGDGVNAFRNHSADNTNSGFACTGSPDCHFVENTSIGNGSSGFLLPAGSLNGSYKDSTLNANTSSDVSRVGLDPGFGNSCSGTVPCP